MADVVLTVQAVIGPAAGGLENATFTSIDATDIYFAANLSGKLMLYFKNSGGGAATVTFDTTQQQSGLDIEDPTANVDATTGELAIGPFPALYNVVGGTNNGQIKFTQDQATGVTVAALRL